MNPARHTQSTPYCFRRAATEAWDASGNLVLNPPQSITSAGMPQERARSRMKASGLSDITTAISARREPDWMAS